MQLYITALSGQVEGMERCIEGLVFAELCEFA